MDSYIHALRWASDRLDESPKGGVIGFITNSGFIRGQAAAGVRKSLTQEFTSIYCYDLRGSQRGVAGDASRQEGGKIFGSSSRAGTTILLLVKNPDRQPDGYIHYADIGDCLSTKDKLDILNQGELANTPWRHITPDRHGDWLDHRNDAFQKLVPLYGKEEHRIFLLNSNGVDTSRDAWCYNFSQATLANNKATMSQFWEDQQGKPIGQQTIDGNRFKWTTETRQRAASGKDLMPDAYKTVGLERPFTKQRFLFGRHINKRVFQMFRAFTGNDAGNKGIALSEKAQHNPVSALMAAHIPARPLTGSVSQFLPRWTYQEGDLLGGEPADNINPVALGNFRQHCDNTAITADDLFYYTYAVLHHPGYKASWATELKKEPARIPYPQSNADFQAFAHAGRELAELHLEYETIDPFLLREVHTDRRRENRPDYYRVQKMALDPEKGELVFNANITLQGIPPAAFNYQIGQYNALRWLVERYQVKTDPESGIVNDPNDWAAEHGQPRYILDLVQRVVAVSVKTMDIIDRLPALD